MRVHVIFSMRYDTSADDLDALTDQLLDALIDVDGIEDPDVTATLAEGLVEVHATATGPSPSEAVFVAMCGLRTALHTIGQGTPGWEDMMRDFSSRIDASDHDDDRLTA